MFLSFFKKPKSGVFIKSKDGFELLDYDSSGRSLNDISADLGYNPFHVHNYLGNYSKNKNIDIVSFDVFTDNIIYIFVKDRKKKITTKELNTFLKGFKYEDQYDSLFVSDYFLEGIANKSLHIDFISKILNVPNDNPNAEIEIEKLGVKLFFVNGYVMSFKHSNDLEKWARYFKSLNKDIIANYARLAKKYWVDDYEMIYNEVNIQAESLAIIPDFFKNEFVHLHKDEFNTINALMLLVCHYGQIINESQFIQLNHGRFEIINYKPDDYKIYKLGKFNYHFNLNGDLIRYSKN